jgi:hypothetical protein
LAAVAALFGEFGRSNFPGRKVVKVLLELTDGLPLLDSKETVALHTEEKRCGFGPFCGEKLRCVVGADHHFHWEPFEKNLESVCFNRAWTGQIVGGT